MTQPIAGQLPYVPARLVEGTRSLSAIRFLVVHDTQSPDHGGVDDATAVAHYFQSAGAGGSANVVFDDEGGVRCVWDREIPAAAPPCNTDGLHSEFCGFTTWTTDEWLAHRLSLERGAYHFAEWSKITGVPLEFLAAADLAKPGATGVTTHAEISAAFHETDHTDPGPNFPMTFFLNVAKAYKALLVLG